MSNPQKKDTNLLLGVIPSKLCKPEQVARWCEGGVTPTYRLQRKPTDLAEFYQYNCRMTIWRDNGTLTYLSPCESNDRPNHERYLSMRFFCEGPIFHITGTTDKAISKTAAFFMTLERTAQEKPFIYMESYSLFYQLHAVGSRCFTNIFKTAPSRLVEFENISLTVKQTIALATRSHPIKLGFWECEFEDGGTAFVEALERRKSSFGSLRFTNNTGFSDDNLKRLLQLDVIDYLELPPLSEELVFLPFSTKVGHLEYEIKTPFLSQSKVESLNIVPKKLSLSMTDHSIDFFPTEPVLRLLRRIAEVGHFAELGFKFSFVAAKSDVPLCVVQEVLQASFSSCNLKVIDLSSGHDFIDWYPNMEFLFQGLKEHKSLRTLKVTDHMMGYFGPDFYHLRRLLSQNRYITVTNEYGEIHTDGMHIDKLYALNRFYRGSLDLALTPLQDRSSLVATALAKSALANFHRTALLLADHTDTLYDLLYCARIFFEA
ncbi:hypothetical protein FisN_13Hu173 [Fistulifera solaris]|jgi:hypothetical protein|uniref:Uncharacterized protein n=1 Tax=Fistulifera solaris TaxID=1519565 RepID=A0A1Z5KN64_FISSO|nr:hypothetical protein FisN_13Hu173 [Fistulifera solaris]|eukprot:GAX27729.1 hypothetical protein FisN_13Hu173 [Fistulifera solaris]